MPPSVEAVADAAVDAQHPERLARYAVVTACQVTPQADQAWTTVPLTTAFPA